MSEYKEYIDSLSKKELKELIIGTKEIPPLLTRDEPTYSRPQITWGLNKFMKEDKLIQQDFGECEQVVYAIMNNIERLKWTSFYNYDYLRFDIKKPSFYWVILILLFSLVGITYTIFNIVKFIF